MLAVVTDYTFPSLDVEEAILRPLADFRGVQAKTPEALIAAVAQADVVITQFAPVNAQVVAAMTKARAIVRYGIGVDNVDCDAARAHGIPVCNIPGYCIDEVADHTLAFLLAVTRQVVPHAERIRSGGWGLAMPVAGFRVLREQTVGLIGFGRIGKEVAARLGPFKCRRLVYDPWASRDAIVAAGCVPASLDELLDASDIVTLHCPSTTDTRKIINAQRLAQMKSGAILANLSRGDLVDTEALVASLRSGHLAAAALDVFDPEPLPADHPLRTMPNIVAAPHLASVSPSATRFLRESVANIAATALRGERVPNVVNGVDSIRRPV